MNGQTVSVLEEHVYELTLCALAVSKKCTDGVKYKSCCVRFLKGYLNRRRTEAVSTLAKLHVFILSFTLWRICTMESPAAAANRYYCVLCRHGCTDNSDQITSNTAENMET